VTLVGHPFDTLKVRLQSQSQANPMYSAIPLLLPMLRPPSTHHGLAALCIVHQQSIMSVLL
jgi:hypothetical protein